MKKILSGAAACLFLQCCFTPEAWSQEKTIVTKPMASVTARILTADELYLSQGTFLVRTNRDYRYVSIDTKREPPKAGSVVSLWGYRNNPAEQTWRFIAKEGGYWKIKSESGFFLTQRRVLAPTLDPETTDDSQLWRVTLLDDGFYTIHSKTNKYLVASDSRLREGSLIGFGNAATGNNNQKWHLIKWTEDGRKTTRFDPPTMGFRFANTFQGIDASYRYGGLCGGMVYTALDYFRTGKPIPQQNYTPANRTPLQSYIYGRQNDAAMVNQLDKWTELRVNPFGWRDGEFYEWGLQGTGGGRIEELRLLIDGGNPAPLGMYEGGTTNYTGQKSGDHQVLGVGYAMGRYKGDKGRNKQDFKILIYDPNYPAQTVTLVPDVSRSCYFLVEKGETWRTYFVDRKYSPKRPPDPAALAANEPDGSLRHLYATFGTGGDDLRGGNDNVHLTIHFTDGTSKTFQNVNGMARWVDNYAETVPLVLDRPVSKSMIRSVTLTTTFGGGIGGDNWNLDWFCLTNGGHFTIVCEDPAVKPLVRFTGDRKTYTILVR